MDFWIREACGAGAWVDRIGGAGAGVHHDGVGVLLKTVGPLVAIYAPFAARGAARCRLIFYQVPGRPRRPFAAMNSMNGPIETPRPTQPTLRRLRRRETCAD